MKFPSNTIDLKFMKSCISYDNNVMTEDISFHIKKVRMTVRTTSKIDIFVFYQAEQQSRETVHFCPLAVFTEARSFRE